MRPGNDWRLVRRRWRGCSGLVRGVHSEDRIRIQRAPVTRIVPEPPDTLSGVENEAGRSFRPLLGGRHLPDGPLHAGTIDHYMGVLLSGRRPLRWEHVAVTVNTPGHRSPTAAPGRSRQHVRRDRVHWTYLEGSCPTLTIGSVRRARPERTGSESAEEVVDALLAGVSGSTPQDKPHEIVHPELEVVGIFPVLRKSDHRADDEREMRLALFVSGFLVLIILFGAQVVLVRGSGQ